jgi:predicted DCC family thiol-disulfide oxidoreductase YuxK
MSDVLLYDATCGLCAASVQFVLRHDTRGTLRFASLQGAFGRQVMARHPELLGIDSVIWVQPASATTPETVATRSDAALEVIAYLGGWWTVLSAARVVPRPVRDAVYRFIATHRHHLTRAHCLVPDSSMRHRFIP